MIYYLINFSLVHFLSIECIDLELIADSFELVFNFGFKSMALLKQFGQFIS